MLIVTYHAIAAPPSPVTATPEQLERDLTLLGAAGYRFVSLDNCAEWLSGRLDLPHRSVVVTFDDAYASLASEALPILNRLRVPATVFVIGGRIGKNNQWAGQWRSVWPMPLADADQIRELLASGISIGSHTWSHPQLIRLDSVGLDVEVKESGDRLEQIFQTSVRHFAYPYGERTAREMTIVKRRYLTAVNARPGIVTRRANPHDLCRADCHDVRVALRLRLSEPRLLAPYLAARSGLRVARRTGERMFGRV